MNGQGTTCGTNIPSVTYPAFCRALPVTPFGGACAPATASSTPPTSWKPAARACSTSVGGACPNSNETCVAKLLGSVGPCISQAGDVACPAAYTQKTLYYDGNAVNDTRACDGSACSCAAPTGSTCDCGAFGCTVDLYTDGSCGTQQTSVPANNTCSLVTATPGSAKVVGATPVPGPCAPGGTATPGGGVTPTGPVTVCCAP
jgi:hypothetical protein